MHYIIFLSTLLAAFGPVSIANPCAVLCVFILPVWVLTHKPKEHVPQPRNLTKFDDNFDLKRY